MPYTYFNNGLNDDNPDAAPPPADGGDSGGYYSYGDGSSYDWQYGGEKKPLVKEEKAQTLSLDGAIAQFGESLKKLDESLKVIEDEAQKNTAYTDSLKGSLVSVMRDALGVLTGFFKDFEDASTEVEMTEEVSDTVPYPASGQEEKGTQENSTEKTINNTDVKNENNDSQVSPDDVLQTSGLRVEGQETAQ